MVLYLFGLPNYNCDTIVFENYVTQIGPKCGSLVARVDSRRQRTTHNGRNDLSWFGLSGPYVQQFDDPCIQRALKIEGTPECKRDLAGDHSVLILGSSAVRSLPR
jgi:hypothetical protein